ncbi:uncharacterized protein LOC144172453 isoform X2 [Haemaphysalis longicornis]
MLPTDVLLSTRSAQYAPSRWGTRLGQRATWCNRVKAATRCFAADCGTKNVPTTEDWAASADGYSRRWQFPNCLGAVDGKHVAIAAPPKSGSLFYNYKTASAGAVPAWASSAQLGAAFPPAWTPPEAGRRNQAQHCMNVFVLWLALAHLQMCLLPLLHSAMLGPGLPPSSTLLQLLCTSMPTASTSASSGAPSTTST